MIKIIQPTAAEAKAVAVRAGRKLFKSSNLTLAVLREMNEAEIDTWFASNVKTLPQAIDFMKKLTQISL